jgi:hypothetical protein
VCVWALQREKLHPGGLRADHQPVRADHQPVRADHQPVRADHQPVRADHQPVRADHQPVRARRRVGVTVQPEAGGRGEGETAEAYVDYQLYCVQPDGSKAVQAFQIPVNEFQHFAKEIDSLARVLGTL